MYIMFKIKKFAFCVDNQNMNKIDKGGLIILDVIDKTFI